MIQVQERRALTRESESRMPQVCSVCCAAQMCGVELEEHLSLFMIAQTIFGALIFLFASKLSSSMFFRLGTGSAGVMMLSVVILLLLVSR